MGCQASLDFAPPAGAHLSFYWTMDEAGAADKVDSTVGLHWPLRVGTLAAPGLFSNGTEINNKIRGLDVINSPSIVVNQATSKGISFWYWVKVDAYGSLGVFCDLNDFNTGNNELSLFLQSLDGATTTLDFFHTNGVDLADVVSPNLSWTLGSWHMVAGVYDKTNHKITSYADGLPVATIADPFVYPDIVSSDWALNSPNVISTNPDLIFDELGLCLNGALTDAQVLALWNGGAGMTWPTVTSVVPYP